MTGVSTGRAERHRASSIPGGAAGCQTPTNPAYEPTTTLAEGCTPQQVGGCIYGQWYLLDTTHQKVLRGPEDTVANLYSDGYKPPPGVKTKTVRVNPGTVLAQAQPKPTPKPARS